MDLIINPFTAFAMMVFGAGKPEIVKSDDHQAEMSQLADYYEEHRHYQNTDFSM